MFISINGARPTEEGKLKHMATAEKYSAKEAALQLGTDARTLRKFIRSSDDFDAVGQGNRYEFTSKDIKALKKKFDAWAGGKTTRSTALDKAKKALPKDEIDEGVEDQDEVDATTEEVDLDDDGEPVDLSDLDPEDEDIEEIEITDDDLD